MEASSRESGLFCVQVAADDLKWMSREQIKDAFRLDLIDQSTMVYERGAPSWRPLSESAALAPRPQAQRSPDYYVEVAPGEAKHLSLEQVRDTLRLGIIHYGTQVYCPMRRAWQPLRDIRGLAEALEPEEVEPDEIEPDEIEPEPSESFYVEISPGEVKTMTLEQLDDVYRLDIIDESTMIWQEGFASWRALGDIIGAHEEAEPPDEFYVQFEPGEVRRMTLEQLDDAYRLDIVDETVQVWRDGFTSWHTLGDLAGLSPQQRSAPSVQKARESLPSLSLAVDPPPARPSPWFGRSLLLVAGVVTLVVAHRHGVLFDAAESLGQGDQFARLAANALGAPGVDTPLGMEQFLEAQTSRYELDKLSRTEPVPAPEARAAAATAKEKAERGADSDDSDATKGADSEKPKADRAKASSRQNKATASQPPVRRSTPAAAPTPQRKSKPADLSKVGVGVKGGDPNDPMNGSL